MGRFPMPFGRRRVTLVALALFFAASVGCALAWNIESLLFFRTLQGMTAGAGMVVGRAIVRDVLDGAEAQRLMSQITLVFAVAPGGGAGARRLAARLVRLAGRVRVSGAVHGRRLGGLLAVAAGDAAGVRRQPHERRFLARSYREVLTDGAVCRALRRRHLQFRRGVSLHRVGAAVFLINDLHVGETGFLWLFGPATLGIVGGAWLSGRRRAAVAPADVGVGLRHHDRGGRGQRAARICWFRRDCPWSVLPIFVYFTGSALAMPSLTLMALDLFPQQRGLAASCQGFVQTTGNAIATAVVAPLVWGSTLTLPAPARVRDVVGGPGRIRGLPSPGAGGRIPRAITFPRQKRVAVGHQMHVEHLAPPAVFRAQRPAGRGWVLTDEFPPAHQVVQLGVSGRYDTRTSVSRSR